MKTLSSLMLLLICILTISCEGDKDALIEKEKVQFAFGVASAGSADGRVSFDLPEGAFLKIKLTPKNSTTAETFDVPLFQMGDGVISEPLELLKGRYFIQDFLIMTGTEVIYATPKAGSPLAQAVIHPLPFSFVVTKDQIANVAMEVVDTEGLQPEQFGYVSFAADVVHPLPLVVFGLEDEQWKMLPATAHILDGATILQTFNLSAKVNIVGLRLDPTKTYVMKVVVAGYSDYATEFNYHTLQSNLNGSPWKIYRGDELVFKIASDGGTFDYVFEGEGTLIADLGNGLVQTLSLPGRLERGTRGSHTFRFLGSLEGITAMSPGETTEDEDGTYHGGYDTYNVNVRGFKGEEFLTSVKRFDLPFGTNLDELLDFSNARSLERIHFPLVDLTHGVKLPSESNLNNLFFWTKNVPTTQEVEEIVSIVYSNTVAKNIRNGMLDLDYPRAVPVSPATTAQLSSLSTDYAWDVD